MRGFDPRRLCALLLTALSIVVAAPPATAARKAPPPPQITAFEMEPAERIAPGAELFFRVQGTPGSRVTVTWSNGQRYPGTVQQVSGSQCLVVFPDGQHHWVDMQYLAPS